MTEHQAGVAAFGVRGVGQKRPAGQRSGPTTWNAFDRDASGWWRPMREFIGLDVVHKL